MKNILVIYYSQTGQLKKIIDAVCSAFPVDYKIYFHTILPVKEYAFPWSARDFMEVFPETYLAVPAENHPVNIDTSIHYDLVLLGWQPWYLSPSLPISSFLHSPEALVLSGKPVVTISGCRNMWLSGYEKLARQLQSLNAKLAGNIVLADPNSNVLSLITIVGWLIFGKKDKFLKIFPSSGIPETSIPDNKKFGKIITNHLNTGDLENMAPQLRAIGAEPIKPALMLLERRGNKIFSFWARAIKGAGSRGNPARSFFLFFFTVYLPLGIVILSPLSDLFVKITLPFTKKKISRLKVFYYNLSRFRQS